ncbi:unnamed protein product [Prorocentrum cordatum]|uniref:Copia protein n=1 Tax=Prorocentrum cordatum TaxID=2364126 RepID=A0ABN9WXC9_9DINO|nr:unnamed protein product [Polarella glacialis]
MVDMEVSMESKLEDKALDQLDDAENATMSVGDVDWEDLGTQLYYMLGECAPDEPGNVVARLRQIMSTQFVTNADVANETEELDLEISKYEKAAEEQLSDNIKKGILLGALQNERDLQKCVFRNLRNLVTFLDKPNHVKDDCRKFKRENGAKAGAKKKAKDEEKQRRAMAAALAAGGGAVPAPGCDGAGRHSQHLTHNAVCREPQQHAPNSSGAASTASTIPTVPTGVRGINGLLAEQGATRPKCIFALAAEHSRPRARSAESSGSRRGESSDSVCVSGIHGVRGIMIDSGAQITAFPYDMLKGKGYLRAIDGAEVQRYGKTDVRLKTGQDVIQISAEAADVEFPVMSTDAITKQGKSVIRSPLRNWIVDSPISPPASANKIKLRKDRGTCYLECDEMLGGSSEGKRAVRMASIGELGESTGGVGEVIGEQLGEELYLSATRKTLRAQVPATEARQQLPTALGPDPSENATLKAKALARPGQPSDEERRARAVHHLPFRPWCSDCVMGCARGTPREVSAKPKGDDEYPVVEMDFVYVATDEIARKYPMVCGYVVKVVDSRKLEHRGRGGLPAILNVVDCRSNASGTIFGSKRMGDYKAHFVAKLIGSWGRATVILLADGENAIGALAEQVKKLRSHSTIARQGPACSSTSMGRIEASSGAAAELLRTLRFSLETKLGCTLELSHSILAFLANAGKFEARFARGIWVGKSEFDDQRLVVDLQRGLLKVRSVRRMPEEFRWNAEVVKQIDVAPWGPVPERVRSSIRKSMSITENMLSTYGPTDSCPKCTCGRGQHSEQCRQRFETIAQERLEAKLAEEAWDGAAPGGGLESSGRSVFHGTRASRGACDPRVMVIAGLSVCELAVCEEDDDQEGGPLWDPMPRAEERCEGLCEARVGRCAYRHELQAMAEHGVYRKIRIADCEPGGKRVGGFPVAREKAGEAFFNGDLTEKIYVHPGSELCERGYFWELFKALYGWGHTISCYVIHRELFKALYGTRLARQPCGENVKATSDDAGGKALKCAPGMFYFANLCSDGNDAAMGVHGDDFTAEGHVGTLDQLGDVLSVGYEITSSPPLGPGHPGVARCLKRVCGCVDQLPETMLPDFFWHADPKHVAEIINFGSKEGARAVDTPGTKAIGAQLRNATDPMPTTEARKTASAGGLAFYLAADRSDIMFASKAIMQDVSKPSHQMNARLMRLARYLEGHQVLDWCYGLQDLPSILTADGDADWAAPTVVARKNTSGGAIRFGNRTWECHSASQATQALSSGESEFYALGSVAAQGLQMKFFLDEVGIEVRLVVASDSAAAPGMAPRHGVGKVRHLELRHLWIQERLRLHMFELVKEDARKMVADVLTKYVNKESMATHLHELNLRMTDAAMMVSTLLVIPGAVAANDQCEMDYGGEKLEAVQSGDFPWLLASLVVVLCSIAYLCGWCVGRHKAVSRTAEEGPRAALIGERHQHREEYAESKQQPSMQAGWRSYTVGELRELLVERGLVLKDGYTRKEELVESAGRSNPTEMQVITRLTNEWKDHGIDVKWRARMLASGRDIRRMLTATAEVMNRLRERLV